MTDVGLNFSMAKLAIQTGRQAIKSVNESIFLEDPAAF
jgi:hypothetical protein